MSTGFDFEGRLRAEMGQVEARPRPGLARAAYQSHRQRQRARRRAGLATAGGAVAVAAAATVIVLPSSGSHSGAKSLAGSSAQPAVKGKPAKTATGPAIPSTVPTSAPTVTYNVGPATADVTVAYVLDQAATALGSQSQVGTGWPAGAYWHTLQQVTSGGKVYTDNTWMNSAGNGVGEGTGEAPFAIAPPEGASAGGAAVSIGEKNYTLAQLDALPTDPAKLWPIVKADEQLPFSSADPGAPKSGQSDLFQSIWNLVTSDPVPTPLRKALYEVAAKIPGVTVAGTYTDSLGRTGTVLHIGLWTMAVDTSNGQVLAMAAAAGPPVTVCGSSGCHQQTPNASTSVYLSAGWAAASSVPKVPAVNGQQAASGSGAPGSASAGPTPSASPTSHPTGGS
jgi:hypothetical protein